MVRSRLGTHLLSTSNGEVRSRRPEQLGETLDDAPRAIEKMTEPQLRAFVFELAVEADLYESWDGKYSDGLVELCGLMKIDLKAAEKGAEKALADAAKSAAAETPADGSAQVT